MSTALLDQWGDSSPDPRQWRLMSKTQRCNMVENILLEHQRFNELLERIDYCSRFGGEIETKNPPCLAILGHTGAGKTTLLDTWLAKAPLRGMETPEGSIIPYLYVLVPSSPKKKGAVAAFLKDLVDQTHVPMVVTGKLGEAEPILEANSQLDRRVGTPLILRRFEWNRSRAETIKEFRTLMRDIDAALPLDPSNLQEEEMAFRFFYASDGYLGWIMEIVREAAIRAIDTGCNSLNSALLATAYENRLAGTDIGEGKVNPFSTPNFTQATVDQLKPTQKKKRRSHSTQPPSDKKNGRKKSQEEKKKD